MTFALLLAVSAALSATAAQARIACTADGFQKIQGTLLSTPYCQDNLIGRVARQRGFRVSDAEIRNNPNSKAEICRFIGQDIRVKHACQGLDAQERGGRF